MDQTKQTNESDCEKVRGTEIVIILERDSDGRATETIERRVPRSVTSKAEYRKKSKQNAVWDWNGTIRLDLSESGLSGEREGIIDVKYVEGGIFVSEESEDD